MKRWILGCLAAAGLLTLASAAGCWYFFVREAPMLKAGLELPDRLEVGTAVAMVIRLSNPHTAAVTLDSIDVSDSLLEHFQVIAVEPEAKDSFHVPLIDQRSWTFSESVPAGGGFAVTFALVPIAPGHFTGNVDACNPTQDCRQTSVDVVVVPAAEPSAGGPDAMLEAAPGSDGG